MHPWELAQDQRGVPPVVGVVLLVAITIILAAGTATFVFGLGDEPAPVAPTSTFSVEYNSTGSSVEITHTGGDKIRGDRLYVRGESLDESGAWANGDGSMSGTIDGNSAVVSSDTWTVNVTDAGYEVRVVWVSTDGERSAELAFERGPGA
jgi:flagellin-like protein